MPRNLTRHSNRYNPLMRDSQQKPQIARVESGKGSCEDKMVMIFLMGFACDCTFGISCDCGPFFCSGSVCCVACAVLGIFIPGRCNARNYYIYIYTLFCCKAASPHSPHQKTNPSPLSPPQFNPECVDCECCHREMTHEPFTGTSDFRDHFPQSQKIPLPSHMRPLRSC